MYDWMFPPNKEKIKKNNEDLKTTFTLSSIVKYFPEKNQLMIKIFDKHKQQINWIFHNGHSILL